MLDKVNMRVNGYNMVEISVERQLEFIKFFASLVIVFHLSETASEK